MKQTWTNQLTNGHTAHYSEELLLEPEWRITAQAEGSAVIHQANVKGPISRKAVEAYFREDLMKTE